MNWKVVYSGSLKRDVQIGFYYRGKALDPIDATFFKEVLKNPQPLIFYHNSKGNYSESEISRLTPFSYILENMADNQVSNQNSGYNPTFYLESIEVQNIKERKVMVIKGFYLDKKMNPSGYLYNVMFERDPQKEVCHIEEIFFQASSKELYDKHFVDFKKSLESIQFK